MQKTVNILPKKWKTCFFGMAMFFFLKDGKLARKLASKLTNSLKRRAVRCTSNNVIDATSET